ncbi:uncharacterized protein LY79DRAFT_35842 [Colletotrichum navitas]|uniref:Uncharacterized protein n=1 Tax=Colletotrichum navitas TaxID=681940 RepID=A0AAD8Q6R8_9PEZI|nr:uncharacterized protein LY79DRAFT_35842 [Colletotrichum navitas]KAK1596926.1 hypothetical protein LY79DRAFT_35842 [Colletotrichum navitas]
MFFVDNLRAYRIGRDECRIPVLPRDQHCLPTQQQNHAAGQGTIGESIRRLLQPSIALRLVSLPIDRPPRHLFQAFGTVSSSSSSSFTSAVGLMVLPPLRAPNSQGGTREQTKSKAQTAILAHGVGCQSKDRCYASQRRRNDPALIPVPSCPPSGSRKHWPLAWGSIPFLIIYGVLNRNITPLSQSFGSLCLRCSSFPFGKSPIWHHHHQHPVHSALCFLLRDSP